MATVATVVNELVIDARGATAGAQAYDAAMAKVEAQIQRVTTSVTQGTARQAAQWDRIAAAIDPVVAATQRMERAQTAGAAAMARGRITLDEYNRVLGTYRERLDQAQRAAAGVQQPIQQMNGAVALSSQQLAGMQFQLQDMAVGLASGQSPFMVIAQQGSQLAQSFASGTGVLAALKAVGAGLVTFFLNPLNLVVIGLAAAAAAVSFFWNAVSGGGEDANAVTERSAELIDRISEAYRDAEKAAGGFYDVVTQGNLFDLEQQITDQIEAVRSQLKDFTDDFLGGLFGGENIEAAVLGRLGYGPGMTGLGLGAWGDDPNFQRLVEMVRDFRADVNAGEADVKAFREELAEFGRTEGMAKQLREIAEAYRSTLLPAEDAFDKSQRLQDIHYKLTAAVADTDGSIRGMNETVRQSPAALASPLGPIQQFIDALTGLNVQLQGTARLMGVLMGPLGGEGGRGLLSGVSGFVNQVISGAQGVATISQWTNSLLRPAAPNVPIPRINPARDLTSDYGVAEVTRRETEARKAAADAAREQERAEKELQRERDAFIRQSDTLVDRLFPAEGALRQAQALREELERLGDTLDPLQRRAIEIEIATLESGGRNKQKFSDAGETLGKAFMSGFDAALKELFLSPNPDLFKALDGFTKAIAEAAIGGISRRLEEVFFGGGQTSRGGVAGGVASGLAGLPGLAGGLGLSANDNAILGGMAQIRSRGGATGMVAAPFQSAFQGLIDDFEAAGYMIRTLSSHRPGATVSGSGRPSFHGIGAAIDINAASNPWVRNGGALQTDMPVALARALAAKWGLGWGGDWASSKDAMHFSAARSEGGMWDLTRGMPIGPSFAPPAANLNLPTAANGNLAQSVAAGTQAGMSGFFGQGSQTRVQQFFQSPAGQGLMAGIGGFSIGFQNQNPLMGALGGGLSGLMSGGVMGGILGALGGVVGAVVGQYFAKQQALKEWNEMAPQRRDLDRRLLGIEGGTLQEAIDSATVETGKYIEAAKKAGVSTVELSENLEAFKQRAMGEFVSGISAITDALDSGLGFKSPGLAAAQTIRSIGKELKSFLADLDNAQAAGALGETDAEKARRSVFEYAKGLLATQEPLSAVRTRMMEIQGAANALQQVMVDLGFESEYAAKVIDSQVRQALKALRTDFERTLREGINDAAGKGYVNDITALIKERDQNLADAAKLGVDRSLVLENFSTRLSAIVDAAALSAEALAELKQQFPDLADLLKQSAQATAAFRDSIKDYLDSLGIGELSTLSPLAQLEEARRQFENTLQKAQGGDAEARSQLTGYADRFLQESRSYNASSPAYAADFDLVRRLLAELVGLPGYAAGGWVTGGVPGRDSVPAMLMPGEYVVPAAQAAAMAAGGMLGGGANDNGQYFRELGRAVVAGANAQIAALQQGFSRLEAKFDALERRQRVEGSREPKVKRA